MNALDENRLKINEIDTELTRLFAERMRAVLGIALYKKENGMEIFDPVREEINIARTAAMIGDDELRPYFENWYRMTMQVSKDYQKALLEKEDGKEGR